MTVQGYSNSEFLAGAQSEGSTVPTQLFTGSDDVSSEPALFAPDQTVAVLTIVAFDATNKLVPWDTTAVADVIGGATDQTEVGPEAYPVGIAAYDVESPDDGIGAQAEIYKAGCFNPDLLVWPAELDTWAKKQAAVAKFRAPFRVKRLA